MIIQFIVLFLMVIIETLLTIITFIITFGCCYYKIKWKLYTELKRLNDSNEFISNNDNNNSIDMVKEQENLTYIDDNDTDNDNESQNSIKILTQNLWIHYLAPSPCKQARLEAFIKFLKYTHYDVLILQEIFGLRFGLFTKVNHLKYLVNSLYKLGYKYYTEPSGYMPYFGQNGGVMLFSKYQFTKCNVYKFNYSDEFMLRKGYAIGIIKIPLNDNNNSNNNNNNSDDVIISPVSKNSKDLELTKLKDNISNDNNYYYLCVGTAHCDPYRTKVISQQINDFSNAISDTIKNGINNNSGNNIDMDCVVGGDFNTRNIDIMHSLYSNFKRMNFYNIWDINKIKSITYRNTVLKKINIYLSIFSCGIISLPSLKNVKWDNGHCLDHLLTNINKKRIIKISAVDTRFNDTFVSDHMGVECKILL